MSKPNFELLWRAFPTHTQYPTLESLHRFIGGQLLLNINEPGFGPNGNTCAVRMSRALNYGGAPIPGAAHRPHGVHALTGSDHRHYIFRVRELRLYLQHALTVRPITERQGFDKAFATKRGIVAFDVSGWGDASGHVALWDGNAFREAHDDYRGLRDDPATSQKEPQTAAMTLWPL